jgi:hypothetical protein
MPSWKKIIVSGSNAELNHITSSGGININGTLNSISDGLTFGDGDTGFYQAADDDLILKRGGNTVFRANTSSQLDIEVSTLFYNTTGGFNIKTAAGVVGAPNYTFRGDTNTGMYRSAADTIGFTAGGVLQLEVTTNKISGSATSTGSFGKLLGDGSSLTGVSSDVVDDTSPQLGGNLDLNSNNITGTGNIDILGTITAQNFIVSSSVSNIEYQSLSGSTIFGDSNDDTHEFTGSLNISGSVNLDKNSHFQIIQPGGGIFKILTTGNQTSIEGGNITLTSNQGLKATKFQSNEINTYSNSYDAIDIGEGYVGATGMRWGYVEIFSNNSKTWTAGQAQLTVAPNSGSFEGIKIVGNQDQAADYLRIQSGSSDILNITHNGSVSGSATSTGSFGRLQTADTVASFGSHTFTLGGNVTTGGTLTTAGNFTTQNNDVTINAVGAGRTLTLNESLTVGDGNDGTITFSGASKTLTVEDNATVDQDLSSDANVTFGSLTTTNNVTVGGDLTINGDTTTISTSNILVQDAFGFFATGSAGTNVDAGIIVQSGSFIDSGSALYHDISKERWSVGKGIASTATNVPDSKWGGFVATVYTASASPVGSSPKYGVGEIHVDDDGEIYIYS